MDYENVITSGAVTKSPCVTCPVRIGAFCGALFGESSRPQKQLRNFRTQTHEGARASENICRRGEPMDGVYILCSGWAFRHMRLPDGRRQILSFLLPGDLFTAAMVTHDKIHFSVDALTAVRFSRLHRAEIKDAVVENRKIFETWTELYAAELQNADAQLVNIGQRQANERIACAILSLMGRLDELEIIRNSRYPFPLRQQHIADYTGLTSVHVGRILGEFRKDQIIELSENVLTVIDRKKLERIGQLN
jgi:CRP/FNR family transcriptional regulator, anaerobic regulatory protein